MSRHLLDINTLLALLDPLHVFHDAAHRWVATTPDLRFVTCPLVQNGVIRIASQSTYPNTLGSTAEVHAVLAHFCADPRHEFCPDDISLLDLRSSHSRRSRARRAPSPRSDRSMTLRGGGSVHKIEDLPTPCLLLDPIRMQRNIDRLQAHLTRLGVTLRPHLKTCKSLEIARLLIPTPAGPAMVSTLQEAEQFAAAGVRDILYAVGIAPNKLARVLALRRAGVDLSVILDSPEQAHAVAAASREARDRIPALIEIDADGHRAGLRPGDPRLLEIGRILDEGGAELRGVMTHAGGSYDHPGAEALTAAAEQERAAVVQCAEALRDAGLPCPVSASARPLRLILPGT